MDLLTRLKTAFPDGTFTQYEDLGRPSYIVSVEGIELKVVHLHSGHTDITGWEGVTLRGPWDIRHLKAASAAKGERDATAPSVADHAREADPAANVVLADENSFADASNKT